METKHKILIAGSSGQLAKEFISRLQKDQHPYAAPEEKEFNIMNAEQMECVLEIEQPGILINCAAYNQVDLAEDSKELAFKINSHAVGLMASLCKKRNIFFIHFSSDYVFDGTKGSPYTEADQPNPVNVYGASKLKGEEELTEEAKDYLIFRLSWVYGNGAQNFLFKLSQWAKQNNQLKITSDEISVPTYTRDVVDVTLKAIDRDLKGMYHLTNSGYCSRYEWAKYYFKKKAAKTEVLPVPLSSFTLKAKRPPFSAMSNVRLSKELGIEIPSWENAVDRFITKYQSER